MCIYRKVPKKLTKETKRSQSIIEEEADSVEGIGEEDEVSSIDTSHVNIKNPNYHIHGQLLKNDLENAVSGKDGEISMKQLQSGPTDYFQLHGYDCVNSSTPIPTFNIISYKKGNVNSQNGASNNNNNNSHLMDSVSENFLNEEGEEEEELEGDYLRHDDLVDTKRLLNPSPHDQGRGLNNLLNRLRIDETEDNDQEKSTLSASTIDSKCNRSTLRGDGSGHTGITVNGEDEIGLSRKQFSSNLCNRNLPNGFSSVHGDNDPVSSVPKDILNGDVISDVSSNNNLRYMNDDELSIEDAADDADLDDDGDDDYIDDDDDDYSEAIESLSGLRNRKSYPDDDTRVDAGDPHLSHSKNADRTH
ncbi:unnamed protein product [[Candida] boidinii]|nr:unnamed protein product [[Candida] boidinii]